jgi:hypothetical protein
MDKRIICFEKSLLTSVTYFTRIFYIIPFRLRLLFNNVYTFTRLSGFSATLIIINYIYLIERFWVSLIS